MNVDRYMHVAETTGKTPKNRQEVSAGSCPHEVRKPVLGIVVSRSLVTTGLPGLKMPEPLTRCLSGFQNPSFDFPSISSSKIFRPTLSCL